jgi:hypothetical protein
VTPLSQFPIISKSDNASSSSSPPEPPRPFRYRGIEPSPEVIGTISRLLPITAEEVLFGRRTESPIFPGVVSTFKRFLFGTTLGTVSSLILGFNEPTSVGRVFKVGSVANQWSGIYFRSNCRWSDCGSNLWSALAVSICTGKGGSRSLCCGINGTCKRWIGLSLPSYTKKIKRKLNDGIERGELFLRNGETF